MAERFVPFEASDTTTSQNDSELLAWKIRRHALRMTSLGKTSHIGSIFSIADILGVLYTGALSINPDQPEWPDRDRFVLSKGHAGAGLYAALAEREFFPVEQLDQHGSNGSNLSGHVSHKGIPGVEFSTGSLGHGLSVGTGIALSAKLGKKKHNVVVLMSDGECDEGSNWEAILFAAHHQLDNLVAIVDYNKLQSILSISETLGLEPFVSKWEAFGWNVIEVDGHDHANIEESLTTARRKKGKPTVLIAHTTKGRGVSFMENAVLWHYRTAVGEEYENAVRELEAGRPGS